METKQQVCVHQGAMCLRQRPHLAPALGLGGVKELLSIGEAACTDLINSTRIKLLCHKGLCCLRRPSMGEEEEEEEGVMEAATGKQAKSIIAVNYHPLTSRRG